ncbi:MAG: class I SAM-dependent methyltransferase [Planctomycetota bacterium]
MTTSAPLTSPDPSDNPIGVPHAELQGAASLFRFRPERLSVSALEFDSTCSFRVGEQVFENLQVIDVSCTGLGLQSESPLDLDEGAIVEDVRFRHRGRVVWTGQAQVVYPQNGNQLRFGIRFLGTSLSLQEMRFRDDFVEQRLGHALERLRSYEEILPAEWRARVTHLHQLLLEAKVLLDSQQAGDSEGRWREPDRSWRLCEAFLERWGPEFRRVTEELDALTTSFDQRQVELGSIFAQGIIMQEFRHCEMMRRAYEKPQGYAGDYRMMELGQTNILEGETLYHRFLHFLSQQFSLGQTIQARAWNAQDAAAETIALDRPVRILCLASGPGVELRRLIRDTQEFKHRVEILLVDQDEDSLRSCLDQLNRACGERGDNPPIEFHCLHFSLRQIIAPKRGAEQELVKSVLTGVDLVYSMGLFDYLLQPLARRTVSSLYKLLNPGGRLFIGNLMRVPDSTWIMEYGVAWNLVYRTEEEMIDLGAEIVPEPASVQVERDKTGHCLFFDARRGEE